MKKACPVSSTVSLDTQNAMLTLMLILRSSCQYTLGAPVCTQEPWLLQLHHTDTLCHGIKMLFSVEYLMEFALQVTLVPTGNQYHGIGFSVKSAPLVYRYVISCLFRSFELDLKAALQLLW